MSAKTASAAETLSAVLQRKHLATVVGQETAGAHVLKSVYDYEDGSSLMLVTSKTFYHDLVAFPNGGILPDIVLSPDVDSMESILNGIKADGVLTSSFNR